MKITFMGAGSTVFARNVIGDCMCSEVLRDSTFALYDIDGARLKESQTILEAMRETMGGYGKIECYLGVENRKEALRGANFVVNAIQVGGYDPCTIIDFEIPKKFGLRQTIADTLGIGGIMRALRTIPVMDVFKLYKPDGYVDWLYASLHTDSDSGSMPQCSGLLRDVIKGSWHGRQVGGQKGADCRNQSYGLAS